ncbi:NAD(P)H-binding protein [Nocardia sp. NBC_01503]|uniref:NAD(P)H-binding protein n=1 Tax=Nocardia sp. NBC_01503 TaxID=2975997 RepID=UPI002E7BF6CB|nr:NAD(P)H-binding protein [Nocardia sp. NBC_01503]WTL33166.1 NAD(P)H-binding protein [Nocardia sp. NBC_01503]
MTTLVTGARGKIGQSLIAQLHTAGLPVRAASADPSTLTVPAGVQTAELRLDAPETFDAALNGITQVLLYAEPAGIDSFVKSARTAGVEHIVLISSSSVLGPNAAEDSLGAHHLEVEHALAASGIPTTVLRPDAFASNALGWAWFISNGMPIEHAYADAEVAPIHTDDIADIAFAALTGHELRGGTYHLTGAEALTFRAQLAVLAEVLDRDIPVADITPEAARAQLIQHMPTEMADSLLAFWAAATQRPAPIADTTHSLLGTPARTFTQWVHEHASAFSRN